MNTWFIADTHFGHTNVIEYDNRPFKSTIEMDKTIIKNWNKVVKGDDIVYHLGDFSFTGSDRAKELIKKLNGRKRLIKGNHDYKSDNWWRDAGFEKVYDKPILWNEYYILSHKPLETQLTRGFPLVNIHGHIHTNKIEGDQFINVGVMHWDYTPVNFNDIKRVLGVDELFIENEY